MKLLVSNISTVRRYHQEFGDIIGHLFTPQAGYTHDTPEYYACDNSAFSNWDETKFWRMVETVRCPKWVAVPDVVGDCRKTNELFELYKMRIPHPLAYVLQDNVSISEVPWGEISCIFIGGTDDFKLSEQSRLLVEYAKSRQLWVHMGRVNSYRRIRVAIDWGCDSVDGSSFSRFPKMYIPGALRFIQTYSKSPGLFY